MSIVLIYNNKEEYIIIPNEAIRVRVIANSNNDKDVIIKEKLKDKLNGELNILLNDVTTINDVRNRIDNNLDFINSFVDKSLKELGSNIDYSIKFGMNYFPEKVFNGIQYDSGLYESLVVTLGKGLGPNYWCVLYPPLCSIDNDIDEIEYRSFIKDIIDNYL